jgi:hypothetical protein
MTLRRREFITLLAAAWPLAARAQQRERMRRIGVLMQLDENDPLMKAPHSAFTQALGNLGWADGRNVRMEAIKKQKNGSGAQFLPMHKRHLWRDHNERYPAPHVVAFVVVLVLYFAPALVARYRGHHNYRPVFLTNLFFGWTIAGWAVALIWSTLPFPMV